MGFILVKKSFDDWGSQFKKILGKNLKISCFWGRKPLEMGPDLQIFWKKKKTTINSAVFWVKNP